MSTNGKPPLRIVRFEAANIKAIKATVICPDPNDPIVLLTGESEQGKSSHLDAIWMALGGKRMVPTEPVTRGEKEGYTFLDFGDFTVRREFDDEGHERFAVTAAGGFKAPSPQKFLSSKFNDRAANPLDFLRLKAGEQVEALQKLVKINLDLAKLQEISGLPTKGIKLDNPIGVLESARKYLYDKRTEKNKDVVRLEGAVKSAAVEIPKGKEATEPVSVAELFEERKGLEAQTEAIEQAKKHADVLVSSYDIVVKDLAINQNKIANLKAQIQVLETEQEELVQAQNKLIEQAEAHNVHVKTLPVPDFTDIDARITEADETNRIAGIVKSMQAHQVELTQAKTDSNDLTTKLTALQDYKLQLIEQAGLPVPGLGFENGEITYNGLPFSQACGRDKLLISAAICAAENPEIGILTFDSGWGDLDKKGRAAIEEWARERGLQIWVIEVREDPGDRGFHIYGGKVVAVNGEAVTEQGQECTAAASGPVDTETVDADEKTQEEVPSWLTF